MTFRPLPWMTVFTVLGLGALIYLGNWQIERMAWKTGLLNQLSAQMDAPPEELTSNHVIPEGEPCENSRFMPVKLSGKLTGQPVFVYGVREAKPAHHIFQALQMSDGTTYAIDLGYVPYDQHDLIPETMTKGADMEITGIIRCPQKPGMFTPETDRTERLWYVADLPAMAPDMMAGAGYSLPTDYYIQRVAETSSEAEWPRTRNPRKMFDEIPNNHLGYALTWYGLAAALFVIYIVYHVSHGRLRLGK